MTSPAKLPQSTAVQTALPQSPITWDKQTVLNHGMQFLRQKNETMNVTDRLWTASMGQDYYSASSKVMAVKVKKVAEESKEAVQRLDNAVNVLLTNELARDPSSEQAKQLKRIALASQKGLNYFDSVANDTYFPTRWNHLLSKSWFTCLNATIITSGLTAATYLADAILTVPSAIEILSRPGKINPALISLLSVPSYRPLQIAVVALIFSGTIRALNKYFRVEPSEKKVGTLKTIFQEAIAPQKNERVDSTWLRENAKQIEESMKKLEEANRAFSSTKAPAGREAATKVA